MGTFKLCQRFAGDSGSQGACYGIKEKPTHGRGDALLHPHMRECIAVAVCAPMF